MPVPAAPTQGPQPWLHDLVPAIQAPVQVWSATSGQVRGEVHAHGA